MSIGLALLALCWAPLVNGTPFFMSDTSTYIRGADAGVYEFVGVPTAWSDEFLERSGPAPGRVQTAAEPKQSETLPAPSAAEPTRPAASSNIGGPPLILAGRSVYYGAFLYFSSILGSLWVAVASQALLAALSVLFTLRVVRQEVGRTVSPIEFVIVTAVLAAVTPVSYFAAYLMPDILTALGILAFAHLTVFYDRQTLGLRLFWFALLSFAVLSHSATLMLVLALSLLVALAVTTKLIPASRLGLAAVSLAIAIALVGELVFSVAVAKTLGAAPVRPPFMAARLIDDGPGEKYLRKNCPRSGFLLCRFAHREPEGSDTLLWTADPQQGIFMALTPLEARRVAQEHSRFVLAVFADRPVEVLASSLDAIGRQITKTGLPEFNYFEEERVGFREKLPADVFEQVRRSAAFNRSMPVSLVESAILPILLVSFAMIAVALRGMGRTGGRPGPVLSFVLIVCGGVLLNTVITGALSTPHDRYQMRVLWLIPLLALAVRVPFRRSTEGASDDCGATQRLTDRDAMV